MCDMKKISEEKDLLLNDINETLLISEAAIVAVEKNMEVIKKRAKENIRSLSLLL